MAILTIVQYPDPILREVCVPVTEISQEILQLLDDMAETMYDAPGVGLAASQVGSLHKILVADVGPDEETGEPSRLLKLINPEIVHCSGKADSDEGCLSIPTIRETIKRHERVVVKALNELGQDTTIDASGFLAFCLQHEIDHLNGVLFIDHLSKLKRSLVTSKLKKMLQE